MKKINKRQVFILSMLMIFNNTSFANSSEQGPKESGLYSSLFCTNAEENITIEATGPSITKTSPSVRTSQVESADDFLIQVNTQKFTWNTYKNEFLTNTNQETPNYLMNHQLLFALPKSNAQKNKMFTPLVSSGNLQLLTSDFYLKLIHDNQSSPFVVLTDLKTQTNKTISLKCHIQTLGY
ncbi:MAG: hypothetical protein A2622_07450 [Bdellovibrionales bacterium RIFCSPHIGHO2_01_FULL_40_29]|nr:MAG: hypothetical protein A2622_07450 [Bdellovibrionales bacterium RIFCSPHIGHO2_01_FULL_40_29]OFZ34241.1 MAG: hypothetical protein A3D17_04200 [Bdellovibrionales bacterium RIFCSPHIGHO2_02_FULL_40_15]